MIITPNFHFKGNCNKAIEFYKEIFDLKVLCLYKNEDANPSDYTSSLDDLDQVYHAEVMLDGTRLMMCDTPDDTEQSYNHSMSLVITYDTADEVKKVYELMKENATILSPLQSTTYSSCFVSLIDKFDMRWEFMTEQTER